MRRQAGVITIYLALTMGLILAMIVTTIEVARVNTAKTYLNRVLQTSMESVLCDYYLPLYERYHIFGFHLEGDTMEDQQQVLIDKVASRATDDLDPVKDPSFFPYILNGSANTFLMCNPKLTDINLNNMVYLTDQGGSFMRNQAIAYTKYAAPLDLLEKLLDALGVVEDAEIAAGVISEKMSLEQDLAAIDQKILQLIELIDGIVTNEQGFEQGLIFKGLSVSDHFIKQFVTKAPTPDNVLINHTKIYSAVEESYLRISEEFSVLRNLGNDIHKMSKLLSFLDNKKELEEGEDELQEEYDALYYTFDILYRITWNAITEVNMKISQALDIITLIEQEKKSAAVTYQAYKENLESKKQDLGEEIYKDLCNELLSNEEDIIAYTDSLSNRIGMIYDIDQMKASLMHNQKILSDILSSEYIPFSIEEEQFIKWNQSLDDLETKLSSYSLQGLEFDYSKVELEEFSFEIFGALGGILCSAIFRSVFDNKMEVSKAKLTEVSLPSKHQQQQEIGEQTDFYEDIDQMYMEIGGLQFANLGISMDGINKTAFDIGESLLFLAYIQKHSTNFMSEDFDIGQVLKYEQEYVLLGNPEDKDNLEEFTTRLVMIRTAFNMISVLTDPEKTSKAASTAKLLGVTGLPFLIAVAKYMILFYWAYSEARVETAALLKGKGIPLYTTKDEFVVSYSDLLMMTNSAVVRMADQYEAKSLIKFNYSDYLLIQLFFVGEQDKTYRMMDLIQENLRYEYDDEFRMSHCLFSFSIQATSLMHQKFLFLPFFQEENITVEGYQLHNKLSVTY